MNWAIGHGSSGGRWARSRGKWRIKRRTNSLLCSQNRARSSRSSSGVSRSEEKIVVLGWRGTGSSGATLGAGRLRRWVFIGYLPKYEANAESGGLRCVSRCRPPGLGGRRTAHATRREREGGDGSLYFFEHL